MLASYVGTKALDEGPCTDLQFIDFSVVNPSIGSLCASFITLCNYARFALHFYRLVFIRIGVDD
jgi:hypothetical protein